MTLLAIDTSTLRAAVAVARADGAVFATCPDPSIRHGRSLIAAVRDLLREAGIALREIDALAVGLGPGSYTGLRIGVTAAKTLAYALGTPLFALDSLDVIARNAPSSALRVSVIADAQRGELFTAEFTRSAAGAPLVPVVPSRVVATEAWRQGIVPGTHVLGPALERWSGPLPPGTRTGPPDDNHPHGPALLDAAREAAAAGHRADPWFLEPVYLRRSAAEDQWDARGGPAAAT